MMDRAKTQATVQTESSLPKRAWAWLGSFRFAVVMIAIVTALSLIGVLYPQDRTMSVADMAALEARWGVFATAGAALGFGSIFTTWYFWVAVAATGLCLLACTTTRISRHLSRSFDAPRTELTIEGGAVDVGCLRGDLTAAIMSALRSPSLFIRVVSKVSDDVERVFAETGRLGFWGSIVFHLALLAVMAGGVVSGLTAFQGRMLVAEGETVVDSPSAYVRIDREPAVGSAYSGAVITLRDMRLLYEGDLLVRAQAELESAPYEGAPSRVTVSEVNYPLDVGGKTFVIGNSGYAVDIAVGGPDRSPQEATVKLGTREPSGYRDTLDLGDITLDLLASPVAGVSAKAEVDRRYDLRSPELRVAAIREDTVVATATLRPEQTAVLDGVPVTFHGLSLWNEFLVRGDRGTGIVYPALWIAVAGLAIRLIDPKRQVLAIRDSDGRVLVSARHRYGRGASTALTAYVAAKLSNSGDRTGGAK